MNIDQYIGIPYVEFGRDKSGVDCWGLIKVLTGSLGLKLPDYLEYEGVAELKVLDTLINRHKAEFEEIDFIDRKFGDIIVFRILGLACHVGFIVDHIRMVHTLEGCDSALERYDRMIWKKRVDGVFRCKS